MKRKQHPENDSILHIEKIEPKQAFAHPDAPHSVLPQHEFSMLIVAPKGSGKTNFICNLILKQYKAYFHKILVFSPTIDNDEKWDVVKKTKHVIKQNVKLEKILGGQEKSQRKVPKVVIRNTKPLTGDDMDMEGTGKNFDGRVPEECFMSSMNLIPGQVAVQ